MATNTLKPNQVLLTVEHLYEEYPGDYLRVLSAAMRLLSSILTAAATAEGGQAQRASYDIATCLPWMIAQAACREEIEERDEIGSLVYGEVGFVALAWMLKLASEKCTSCGSGGPQVFYDLGSGSGRMVVAAALLHPGLRRCAGIEIIKALHNVAEAVRGKMEQAAGGDGGHCREAAGRIEFSHGDILEADWRDADIVLVNSTCFTEKLMRDLEARAAELLRPGSVIITFTSAFEGPAWEVVSETRRQMSWGAADIFVHRKLRPPVNGDDEKNHQQQE